MCCEVQIHRDEQLNHMMELFPSFTNEPLYDKLLSTPILLMYAEGRGVGLSPHEAAHAADMSTMLVDKILRGEGISLEKFIELIKVELHSIAHTKRLQLSTIVVAGATGNEKAAQSALENVFPTEYGKHIIVDATEEEEIHMTYSVVTAEDRAKMSNQTTEEGEDDAS